MEISNKAMQCVGGDSWGTGERVGDGSAFVGCCRRSIPGGWTSVSCDVKGLPEVEACRLLRVTVVEGGGGKRLMDVL